MELRTFKTYTELEKVHQEDVNNFPMVWMFGSKTDAEILECISEIGAKSLDDCIGNGCGGLILKVDKQKYDDMWERHRQEREVFTESEENLYQMILSEMNNHEYGYTRNPHDTLAALGKSFSDFETDEKFNLAWCRAQKQCYQDFDECN